MPKTVEKRILETHTEWVDPSNLFTTKEQIDQCCEPVETDVCADVGREEEWHGRAPEEAGWSEEDLLIQYQAKYPDKKILGMRVESVGTAGACGKKYTEWDDRLDCCDQVIPLEVNDEDSVEIIADYSTGMIYVTGGRLPLRVKVSGHGFYVANSQNPADGLRDAEVWGRVIPIKTLDACGVGLYVIDDGCTTASHSVRAPAGQWVPSGNLYTKDNSPCHAVIKHSDPVTESRVYDNPYTFLTAQKWEIREPDGALSAINVKVYDGGTYLYRTGGRFAVSAYYWEGPGWKPVNDVQDNGYLAHDYEAALISSYIDELPEMCDADREWVC